MDNPLQKYLNKTYKIVSGVAVKQGTTKEGSSYIYLELQFTNGFVKRMYPNDAERFAIINAIDLGSVTKQMGLDESDPIPF